MNKKAQLGKIITTLPVMFLLIIVLGIFIALVSGISIIKGFSINSETILTNNLLLKTADVTLQNGSKQKMLIADAVSLILEGKRGFPLLQEDLKSLITEQNPCVILFEKPITYYGYKLNSEQIFPIVATEKFPIQKTYFNSATGERKIEHYQGRCVE